MPPAQQTETVADESPAESDKQTQQTISSSPPNESTESENVSTRKKARCLHHLLQLLENAGR